MTKNDFFKDRVRRLRKQLLNCRELAESSNAHVVKKAGKKLRDPIPSALLDLSKRAKTKQEKQRVKELEELFNEVQGSCVLSILERR